MRSNRRVLWCVLAAGLAVACGSSSDPIRVDAADVGEVAPEVDQKGQDSQIPEVADAGQDLVEPTDTADMGLDLTGPDAFDDVDLTDVVKPPCLSNDDCSFCEACDVLSGLCLAIPCAVQCIEDEDCGANRHCETQINGCCGVCVADVDCSAVNCVATCSTDLDCAPGDYCIVYADGCCSQCQPVCEICYLTGGEYCHGIPPSDSCELGDLTLTEVGTCWFEFSYTGLDGTDVFLANGCGSFSQNLELNQCGLQFDDTTASFDIACNWCGEVNYSQENCDCLPDCAGKQCGPDGCGGVCGQCNAGCMCDAAGQCLGCTEPFVELQPICAHAPYMVSAGKEFAVAVYGLPGCTTFDHYDVTTEGTVHSITLMGTASADPDCPQLVSCDESAWSFLGLVWLSAPTPGAYTVHVGDAFSFQVVASGGIIEGPGCDDACPVTHLEDYSWNLKAIGDQAATSQCLDATSNMWVGADVSLTGGCQTYTLGAVLSLPEIPVYHCAQGHLLFGTQAPYWMEGHICGSDPLVDGHPTVILGTIQDDFGSPLPGQFFLVEGTPLWN